eukprot:gnl/TRDRNA2_/TRDRNA2_51482_c0_seq1.p1 gnl/TRDRNA2_/TRDRNA2_51482_c0~~gnl/TRDRNA2_/TRDRNA2_51482_c0_seq1.p1  ORF type:complete len:375 (+),score=65.43 gnl/TRDRNA2_/TRDRNA2_51482_c0_seq1:95-1219(+)
MAVSVAHSRPPSAGRGRPRYGGHTCSVTWTKPPPPRAGSGCQPPSLQVDGGAVASTKLFDEIQLLRRERDALRELVLLQHRSLSSGPGGLTGVADPFSTHGQLRSTAIRLEHERLLAAQEATARMHPSRAALAAAAAAAAAQEDAEAAAEAEMVAMRPSADYAQSAFAQSEPLEQPSSRSSFEAPLRRRIPSIAAPAVGNLPRGSGSICAEPASIVQTAEFGSRPPSPPAGNSVLRTSSTPKSLCSGRAFQEAQSRALARAAQWAQSDETTVQDAASATEPLHEALHEAVAGLTDARLALADAAQQLSLEAQKRSVEAISANILGVKDELRALRNENARLRREARQSASKAARTPRIQRETMPFRPKGRACSRG